MQFNYNLNPIEFSSYYRGLENKQKREANDLLIQQQKATAQQQAQLQPLVQAYLGGDASALNQIAGIDSGKAAELQKLVAAQQPKEPPQLTDADLMSLGSVVKRVAMVDPAAAPAVIQQITQQYPQLAGFGNTLIAEFQRDPAAGIQMLDRAMAPSEPKEDKTQLEFLKEERQVARTAVDNFNKRAQDVRSSYGKIEGLLQKDKLSRADIASGITALARLNSPGIVTDFDFSSLAGGQDPVAFAIERLRGAGMDEQSINQLNAFYDPTNPNLFNKDAFLQTAKAVAGAEMPALVDAYEMARERALRAGIAEDRIKAIFDENRNYQFAKGFAGKPKSQAPQLSEADKAAYEWAMKNPNDPRASQIKQRLGVQ